MNEIEPTVAVLDDGLAGARIVAALTENATDTGERRRKVLGVCRPGPRPWWCRYADQVVRYDPDAGHQVLAELLAKAEAQMVWPSPLNDLQDLRDALTDRGIHLVMPSRGTISALQNNDLMGELSWDMGLFPAGEARGPQRRIDVEFLADSAGGVWMQPPRQTAFPSRQGDLFSEAGAEHLDGMLVSQIDRTVQEIVTRTGYVGAGVVNFAVSGDQASLLGVDVLARPWRGQITDVRRSWLSLRPQICAGGALGSEPPWLEDHYVEAQLCVDDSISSDSVVLQRLWWPAEQGVAVSTQLREGDVINPITDPLVATVGAHGTDRRDAVARLRRTLIDIVAVPDSGGTNRCQLVAALDDEAFTSEGAQSPGIWQRAQEAPEPEDHRALAVAMAAIEAYESDAAEVRGSFLRAAANGRPEHPEQVGTRITLSSKGSLYSLRVDETSEGRFSITSDDDRIDVGVDRLGGYERLVSCLGRRYRVVIGRQRERYLVEVDGSTHTVVREDGSLLRSQWPALVDSVLVEPGQRVEAGQAVAVLESMKMLSAVTAPASGTVTSVLVHPKTQIEAGTPLLALREDADADENLPVPHSDDGLLNRLASGGSEQAGYRSVIEAVKRFLLGYDLPPSQFRSLLARVEQGPGTDSRRFEWEDDLLDLFADVGALYRPRTESDPVDSTELTETAEQEYFHTWLQTLDVDRARLPERYRQRLQRVLSRYGIEGLSRTPTLERAVVRVFRAFSRVPEVAKVITAILRNRLSDSDNPTGTDDRARLERLLAATTGRNNVVADLARDLIYHVFDEPVMKRGAAEVLNEMERHLRTLRVDPGAADRERRVERLVWCPQPMRGTLLRKWVDSVESTAEQARPFRFLLLETYMRRYYRMRDLRQIECMEVDGVEFATALYDYQGKTLRLMVQICPEPRLRDSLQTLCKYLADNAADIGGQPILDVLCWTEDELPEVGAFAAQLCSMVDRVTAATGSPRLHRVDVTTSARTEGEFDRVVHVTMRPGEGGYQEDRLYRNLHPMLGKRLDLWRLHNFDLERLRSPEDVYLFEAVAKDNPKDRRLFALAEVRDLVPMRNEATGEVGYPRLGRVGISAIAAMRTALARYPVRDKPNQNQLILTVRPPWDIPPSQWPDLLAMYEPMARGAALRQLTLNVLVPEDGKLGPRSRRTLVVDGLDRGSIRLLDRTDEPIPTMTRYDQLVATAARFGAPYPYEIIRLLTPAEGDASTFPTGSFQELDLAAPDQDVLVPVNREPGGNTAHLVVGLITNYTEAVPEGMTRVAMLSDPTQGLGNLAEPECRRINACLAYALEHKIPVEWYAVSSGALIAMDSGTENMDFIALTLRRLIEYTQAGGEVNIIVTGINVGGQPYWNAEATMLMHTKGVLIMTPASAMVLTGKQALDFSGAVSADDNFGIGGFDRIMGGNGQGQYWAPTFPDACRLLLRHYDFSYRVPGERFPRTLPTGDPHDRDVCTSNHRRIPGSSFDTVGDVFSERTNPERKEPFDMRSVMRAVADLDCPSLERWNKWIDAETSIVWDARVGGIPVCMIGLESRTVARKGQVPSDGPPSWTSGTLFPQSSRKTARAVNAASGNRPLVVLANLSGFDGSPESMRRWQLEYGAEIGRAVTNFDGPIVFVVVSRYHGGAFVVFSKALSETMEIAAVEGSFASVIGGSPAAATVFAREVKQRTERDERVTAARAQAMETTGAAAGAARLHAEEVAALVRSEKLGEVAAEFDSVHTIERAMRVGSVDRIIPARELRPYVIDALQRGMAKFNGGGENVVRLPEGELAQHGVDGDGER